jgi:hypothetical protein
MLAAVEFDHEPGFGTVVVGVIRTDVVLSAELEAEQAAAP